MRTNLEEHLSHPSIDDLPLRHEAITFQFITDRQLEIERIHVGGRSLRQSQFSRIACRRKTAISGKAMLFHRESSSFVGEAVVLHPPHCGKQDGRMTVPKGGIGIPQVLSAGLLNTHRLSAVLGDLYAQYAVVKSHKKPLRCREFPDALFLTAFANEDLAVLFTNDIAVETLEHHFAGIFRMNNTI